jgi:hypothetical protein
VNFAAITLCVASQRVFIIVVYFVIDSVRKLLDTPSCVKSSARIVQRRFWRKFQVVTVPHRETIRRTVHKDTRGRYCTKKSNLSVDH